MTSFSQDPAYSLKYSEKALLHNAQILDVCRSSFAMIAGICAGILGLPSISGFCFFFLGSLVMSTLIYFVKLGGWKNRLNGEGPSPLSLYFASPSDLWTGGLTHAIFAYILFWTMVNGIIRIYG